MRRALLGLLVLASIGISARRALAQEADEKKLVPWESFDFAKKPVALAQIQPLNAGELKLLRGIVFGRHGRVFKDIEINEYLEGRPWYSAAVKKHFSNASLSEIERRTLDVIREAEARHHRVVQLGDMRFYQHAVLNTAKLGEHTLPEWRILRGEIGAEHGESFAEDPWLQQYFNERYWYKTNEKYSEKVLSPEERKNAATIDSIERAQRQVRISETDLPYYQDKPIPPAVLKGLSLYDLRILRNAVYARHGHKFATPWLRRYFADQGDDETTIPAKETPLTETEQKNVALIVSVETGIHERLSTEPVDSATLSGLFLEDSRRLRNEIYARHGKVFTDKWLKSYFSSLPWYKADPNFTDASLTPIERANALRIAAHEKTALSAMTAFEG
ncbi:MAG: YARHG domain-containing protein [Gemmatimonadota bacterium]|nr:YARHG domain-containing protein [Gemmatimonadota bacterium]